MKYSIVVPVYNTERYLKRCIDSILSQTIEDFEVILVDDGAKDSSGAICDQYATKDKRVVVIHQQNKGVSAARNAGISVAKGLYLIFVDSDDVVETDYLYNMDKSQAEFVVSGVKCYEENNKIHHVLDYSGGSYNDISHTLIEEMIGNQSINFIYSKRYLLNKIKESGLEFSEDISLGEDTLFAMKYVCQCRSMEYVGGSAYHYYKYDANTLSAFNDTALDRLAETKRRILDTLEACYPEVKNSHEWKSRCWNDYYYSIFYILREWDVSVWKKIVMLQKIFNDPQYRRLENNLDEYMKNDSAIVRNVLRTKNSIVVVVFWMLLEQRRKV